MKQAILVAMLWVGSAMAGVAQSPVYQLRIYNFIRATKRTFMIVFAISASRS